MRTHEKVGVGISAPYGVLLASFFRIFYAILPTLAIR